MELVKCIVDIKKNINVIDEYIENKKDPEYSFSLSLIKRGTCFISYLSDGVYKFYPSRFIGYKSNSMDAHQNNQSKDGTETNPAISSILKSDPVFDINIEKEYYSYCRSLGFEANEKGAFGVQRKYWRLNS